MSDIGPKAGVDVPVVIHAGGLGTRLREDAVMRPSRLSKLEVITEDLMGLSADPDLRMQLDLAALMTAGVHMGRLR